MAHTAQDIFRVILVHNKLMATEDIDALLADTPDPEDCIANMIIGEMLTEEVAEKVMTLYRHNLAKQGMSAAAAPPAPSTSPAGVKREHAGAGAGHAGVTTSPTSAGTTNAAAPPVHAGGHANHAGAAAAKVATPSPTHHAQGPASAPGQHGTGQTSIPGNTPPPVRTSVSGSAGHAPTTPTAHTTSASPGHATAPHTPPAHAAPTTPQTRPGSAPAPALPAVSATSDELYASIPLPGGPIDISHAGRELIFALLRTARSVRASDLHIKADAIPVVRVCTLLRELQMPAIPSEILEQSLLSILTDTQRGEFLKKRDIDFSFDTADFGRFRGNYLREHRGMDAVFRLISGKVPTFEELKLPEQIKRFCTYRQGIVLVTGPKGSGKTTTLASLIDLINTSRAEHIITIEDPIEFVHPSKKGHVNQREVGPHTDSFANALRAALREAPDVIMVGEMRDLETISLAITAAETGHLVFGTLHTPDAARTINRVLDVYPPEEQPQVRTMFSESLRGIICQHLLPGLDGKSMHLAVEILVNTSAIGNLIRDNRAFQLKGMMQTGKKLGMVLMDESLVKLVREGKISREDALSRSDNQAQMERDFGHLASMESKLAGAEAKKH